MGLETLPLSMAVGEETPTGICEDTGGLLCVSAPHMQETGKGMTSFLSILLLNHPFRLTTMCTAQAGPAPSRAFRAGTVPQRIMEAQAQPR